MKHPIENKAILDQIFLEARTFYAWQNKEVSTTTLEEIYELMKFGPTSANCCPLRIIFIKSETAKNKLKSCLAEGNIEKTMSASLTAIFAYDEEFYEHLPFLSPQMNAKSWFVGNPTLIKETAILNAALQSAYFMIAARIKGLDCGPMSGFDKEKTNETFLNGTTYKSLFLCNLGYGLNKNQYPRAPRFEFNKICTIE